METSIFGLSQVVSEPNGSLNFTSNSRSESKSDSRQKIRFQIAANQILSVSIHHMIYPITEEVLHQVFDPYGYVEKIVIASTKSNEFQALVQFESSMCAAQAKTFLQGKYIYDGVCQMDIQYFRWDENPGFKSNTNVVDAATAEPKNPCNFRSDSTFSFRFESRYDVRSNFSSNEIDVSFGASAEKVESSITTDDLNFIRNEILRIIAITDRIQDRLDAMNSTIQNFTHTMSKSSQATSLISVISPTKSKDFQTSLQMGFKELKELKQARINPPQTGNSSQSKQGLNTSSRISGSAPKSETGKIGAEESEQKDSFCKEVKMDDVDLNLLEKSSVKLGTPTKVSALLQLTDLVKLFAPTNETIASMFSPLQSRLSSFGISQHICFEHGKIDCVVKLYEVMFEKYEYKMFDLMLQRNDKEIFDKNVFIFDPGGSIFDVDDVFEIRPTYGDAQIIILAAMLDIDNNLKVLLHTINASEKYAYVVHSNSCLVVVYKMLYKLQWPPSQNYSLIPHILFSNFQFHITLIKVEADVGIFTNIFWRGLYSDILDSTIDLKWLVEIIELNTQLNKVYSLDWSPKKNRIVGAAQDGRLIAWNALASQKTHAIKLSCVWVMTCAISPDGQSVACGGLDSACSIFNLNSQADRDGNTTSSRTLTRHKSYVSSCQYIPDEGNKLNTSPDDQTCGLWDVTTGQKISVYGGEYPSRHIDVVLSVPINNSNSNMFVSGSCDATARLWDARIASGVVHAYHGHEGDVHTVKFFPYGQRFGTGSNDGTCRLFDMQTGHQLQIYSQQHGDNDSDAHIVTSITFSISEDSSFLDFPMVIVMCGTIDGLDVNDVMKQHILENNSL